MVLGSGIRDPGSGIRDPGSGKNLFRSCIPDPGVKKHPIPDPGSGSGSATLIKTVSKVNLSSSRIPDPEAKKGTGSRIRIHKTAQYILSLEKLSLLDNIFRKNLLSFHHLRRKKGTCATGTRRLQQFNFLCKKWINILFFSGCENQSIVNLSFHLNHTYKTCRSAESRNHAHPSAEKQKNIYLYWTCKIKVLPLESRNEISRNRDADERETCRSSAALPSCTQVTNIL